MFPIFSDSPIFPKILSEKLSLMSIKRMNTGTT